MKSFSFNYYNFSRIASLFVVFYVFFIPSDLIGSHGAGGEITYRCLGDNRYEFTLTYYKDCGPSAATNLPFNVSIIVYDSDYDPVLDIGVNAGITLQRISNDTLHIGLDDECLHSAVPYCIHRIVYRREVELPFIEGGYHFSYGFCCRNRSVNILGSNMVFYAYMPEDFLLECNDGIMFKDYPSLYHCVNERFEFDHAVANPIGDSISYQICTPFGSEQPPFPETLWADSYGVNNTTGGNDPILIDPSTGILTGTPIINGTFTFSVCVEEFIEGVLIRTAKRDIQFKVGPCVEFEADFFIPDLVCGAGELGVENLTRDAIEFEWMLSKNDSIFSFSQKRNPIFEIDSIGYYEITLIAKGDSDVECLDTLTVDFEVIEFNYDLDLTIDRDQCEFPLELKIKYDISPKDSFDLLYFMEVNVPGMLSPIYSDTDSLWLTLNNATTVSIEFRAIDNNTGCWIFNFTDYQLAPEIDDGFSDTLFVCGLEFVELNEFYSPFNEYVWDPPDGMLDSITTPNPRVRPLEPTTYTAQVKNEFCEGTISYNVTLIPPEIPFLPDTICGTRTIELSYNPLTDFAQNFSWRFYMQNTLVGSRIGDNPTFTFPAYGEAEIELIPFRPIFPDCADTFRQTIYLYEPMVDLNVNYEKGVCSDSVEVIISAEIDGFLGGGLTYVLVINNVDSVFSNQSEFSVWLEWEESFDAKLIVISDHGCQVEEDFIIEVEFFPDLTGSESFKICRFDTLQLINPLETDFDFYWGNSDFFISDENDPNPWVVPDTSTVYELFILHDNCEYLYSFKVEVEEPETYELPDFVICDSVLTHRLNLPEIEDFETIRWVIGDLSDPEYISHSENPLIEFEDFGSKELSIIVSDSSNCGRLYEGVINLSDVSSWTVFIEILETNCVGNEVEIVLNGEVEGQVLDDVDTEVYWVLNETDTFDFDTEQFELSFIGLDAVHVELFVKDEFGCSQVDFETFNFEFINTDFLLDSLTMCLGDTIYLLSGANTEFTYSWSPAFGFISQLTEPNPLISPEQSIQYTANINSDNCSAEHNVFVEILTGPEIMSISADPEILFEPGESFLNIDIVGDYTNIEWRPGELLDNSFVSNPVGFIEETTTFSVLVSDAFGCIDSIEITVFVEKRPCAPPFVFLPNAFSPNGDGMNDVLYVRGEDIINMELRIYNRYGQEVFYSNDKSRGWDGVFGGEDMPAGVYAYFLKVECRDGMINELKGNINLLR
ncbi:MAG: gliding motility-associated C-terminal domain-containing protein [Saprospirales bacterium]|nr:MAG: gliding motility-associated C-terminal domain-containing protein [Saprospirales bacterium]